MHSKRLLIVDDDESLRIALKKTLLKVGYEVFLVSSGEEALRFIEQEWFDLVLTDYQMSGMTGLEVAEQILQRSGRRPDVILMTAYGDLLERSGACDGAIQMRYLHKPIKRTELLALLDSVLGCSR